jgi:NAD(P)H-dependent flavin oxidoreductase YrpB (nitropropane dioxygenase family)
MHVFHTQLCDILRIRYPIIQGALGGISGGPQLAAAVSNAGGLGVLASFNLTDKQLRDEIARTRSLGGRHHTHASLLLKQGVHPKIVSERLGHATVAFTLDTYTHVVPGLQEAAAKALTR